VDVSVKEGNKESILQGVEAENEEREHKFMNVNDRYINFEQKGRRSYQYT
jgi:hypothetical protein